MQQANTTLSPPDSIPSNPRDSVAQQTTPQSLLCPNDLPAAGVSKGLSVASEEW